MVAGRAAEKLTELAPRYLELLADLVRIPSPTGAETACQRRVEAAMRELGLEPHPVFASNAPPYHSTGRDYAQRPSLVGRLPGSGSHRFMLNAHIDTAPVGPHERWTVPPYEAVLREGRLYGRGAVDDKAGVAMMLLLADVLRDVPLQSSLFFASVIEDEDSGNGTLSCTEAGYWCDHAVILDGTWGNRALDGHLGQLWLRFVLHGRSVPACVARRGENAAEKAMELVRTLQGWAEGQNRDQPEWAGLEQPFFVSLGRFEAGHWAGVVPDRAELDVQLGFPSPFTPDSVLDAVRSLLPDGAELSVGELCTGPYLQRPNSMAELLGVTDVRAVTGHCDLRHLRREDGSPATACLHGPGGGANAHLADEYYLVEHFEPVAQTVLRAILQLNGAP